MKKTIVTAAMGMAVTTALLCGPVLATGASATTGAPASASQEAVLTDWTAADWRSIAEQARAAGDLDGAAVSSQMADRVASGVREGAGESRNIWTTIAKKAVIQALRYGVDELPTAIRPYVNKIINVVEEIDQFQQGAVVLALTKAGIPYDIAVTTAQWIVVFIGL